MTHTIQKSIFLLFFQEEIFGPVLLCRNVDSMDEAIKYTNSNPFGNGTAIFTSSGAGKN